MPLTALSVGWYTRSADWTYWGKTMQTQHYGGWIGRGINGEFLPTNAIELPISLSASGLAVRADLFIQIKDAAGRLVATGNFDQYFPTREANKEFVTVDASTPIQPGQVYYVRMFAHNQEYNIMSNIAFAEFTNTYIRQLSSEPVPQVPTEQAPPVITIPPSDGTYQDLPPIYEPPYIPPVTNDPTMPPVSMPPSNTLPAISGTMIILGGGALLLFGTKQGKKLLRRLKL